MVCGPGREAAKEEQGRGPPVGIRLTGGPRLVRNRTDPGGFVAVFDQSKAAEVGGCVSGGDATIARGVVRPSLRLSAVATPIKRRAIRHAAAAARTTVLLRLEFNIPGVTFGGRYDASPLIVGATAVQAAARRPQHLRANHNAGRSAAPHVAGRHALGSYDTFNFEWTLLVLGPNPPDATPFEVHAASLGIDLRAVVHQFPGPAGPLRGAADPDPADQIVAWHGFTAETAPRLLAKVTGSS